MLAQSKNVEPILADYHPRWYQEDFEKAMFGGYRRAYLLYHRRAGKDFSCWMFMIYCALRDLPGIYYYILPTYAQGKKVIWDAIDESGKRFLDYIPREAIIGKPNQQEMKIRLCNGSLIQIIGSDNPDSIRGTNPKGVVFSEYALQDPRIWHEIISPIFAKNNGWGIFNTTPRGKNHAWELWEKVQDSPFWFTQKLTIEDTQLISTQTLDQERADGKSEELIQQEYYVSWSRGVEGSYYGRLLDKARLESRITTFPVESNALVHTAWDIGFSDSTAIVFWQEVAKETRIIDYYENAGEGFPHYAKLVQSKPYVYGTHYFPHDAANASIQTALNLQQVALDLGIKTTILPRDDIQTGIEQARSLLGSCYIDSKRCEHLLKCLENYRKRYNEKLNCYSDNPQHDQWSHGSDSFRYMAMAKKLYGNGPNKMKAEDTTRMYEKFYGYTGPQNNGF
jgi:phage terminase large subunit